jgi:acyl transferase domain-containing protein
MLVLKRLRDAERDGDRIAAVILGTAMGNSGRGGGSLTTPSGGGQRQVMLDALAETGVDPASVEYAEAHGTGSRVGDPVELATLMAVYGGARRTGAPCLVGSVKSNLGHAESAAGVAGLIKTVGALLHGVVPATLHVRKANPALDWETAGIALAQKSAVWARPAGGRRRAVVNGLSLTGTNVHVVLEEAPEERRVDTPGRKSWVMPVTAASEAALRARAGQMAAVLADGAPVEDVCWTAAVKRSALAHRCAVTGRDAEELREQLERFAAGEPALGAVAGVAERTRKVAFVFPGNGSHWIGMGRELLATERVFREAMEACDAEIARQAGWSALRQLADDGANGQWARTEVIQPLLFAEGVALAALWQSWGVRPTAVVGHSMGEVAAAHVAGILTLADAVSVICRRSELMQRVAGQGAMAVLNLPEAEAAAKLAGLGGRVVIAGANGPRSVLLSGDPEAVGQVVERMETLGVYCRRVKFDVASHSPQMDPLKEELRAAVAGVRPQSGTVALYSTVTGAEIEGAAMDADYWVRNLREPVWFARTVAAMAAAGCDAFVEMSPHPVLAPFVEQTADVVAVGSTRREEPEAEAMLTSLGRLWAAGGLVDWTGVYPAGNRVALPAYPWQRERYWIEARESAPRPERPAAVAAERAPLAATDEQGFLERWQRMSVAERGPAMKRWVREQVAAVLHSRVEEVSVERALKAQGLNSLMTLELQNRVERGLGMIRLSAGTAWNYPTVEAFAEFLRSRLGERERAVPLRPPVASERSSSAAELLEEELARAEIVLNRQGA